MLSEQAQVAKLIRKYCRDNKIKCSVQSESFSGGTAVNVTIYNPRPKQLADTTEYANKFKLGHFDGMIDCYEYSNRRDDIPQAKFIFVRADYSDDIRAAAWKFVRENIDDAKDAPESLADAGRARIGDMWADGFLDWFLSGETRMPELETKFWRTIQC